MRLGRRNRDGAAAVRSGARRIKPAAGRSLSVNSYYRPVSNRKLEQLHKVPDVRKESTNPPDNSGRRKLNTVKIVNAMIVAVFVFLAVSATTLSAAPHVKIVESDGLFRSEDEYSSEAAALFKGSILNRSKFLFRSSEYEAAMHSEFPEVESVEAIVPLIGRDLSIVMKVSAPLAKVINGDSTGILDDNGILTDTNSDTEGFGDLFVIRFDSLQNNFNSGSKLLTDSEVMILRLLQAELSGLESAINEVLFRVKDGQFEVSIVDTGYKIRLSTYGDPAEQVGAFKAAIKQLSADGQPPEQYIDVRVPGRVFVK